MTTTVTDKPAEIATELETVIFYSISFVILYSITSACRINSRSSYLCLRRSETFYGIITVFLYSLLASVFIIKHLDDNQNRAVSQCSHNAMAEQQGTLVIR